MDKHGHPTARSIEEWLERIREGRVALPRFQRGIVWSNKTISDMILALLQTKPVGALLVLQPETENGSLPFKPHKLRMAPEMIPGCDQLILDGQQRLTALWCSLTDAYDQPDNSSRRRFFLKVSEDADGHLYVKEVSHELRSRAQALLNSPQKQWEQKKIPLSILGAPGVTQGEEARQNWCDVACDDNATASRSLEREISKLSNSFLDRDIAFYALAKETSREEAITAFIKVNVSSSKITRFDIAVAEIEKEEEKSLRELIENIEISPDRSRRFFGEDRDKKMKEIGELVLKISCLLSGFPPTDSNYTNKAVISKVLASWKEISSGINFTLKKIFEKESLFDRKRLPSVVPLRVLPALFVNHSKLLTNDADKTAKAIKTIRKYIWRAFLTQRYAGSVDVNLAEDYNSLDKYLSDISEDREPTEEPKIFDAREYPLPSARKLSDLDEPVAGTRLHCALMGISLRGGAKDIATDEEVDVDSIHKRQYHHLFPVALLEREGNWTKKQINHVLNLALISATTNNKIQARPPIDYLKDRLKLNPNLKEEDLKKRINSHRIPYEELKVENGKGGRYKKFLRRRADMFEEIIAVLADGDSC